MKKMTSSQMLGKITTHEMTMNMEVEAHTLSNIKNLALTSKQAQCQHMKARMRRKEQELNSSEDDGDEDEESYKEDEQSTSSDEEVDSAFTNFISHVEKNIKKFNTKIDHPISMKVKTIDHIKKEKKTKIKKRETKGRAKALMRICPIFRKVI